MPHNYRKGAEAERELIHRLFDAGFAVVRVAGSGKSSLPAPDILALSPQKKFAIEVKAWASDQLSISKPQMLELADWCHRAGVTPLVAWKVPRNWFFLRPEDLHETGKAFAINRHDAEHASTPFDVLVGRQTRLRSANSKKEVSGPAVVS